MVIQVGAGCESPTGLAQLVTRHSSGIFYFRDVQAALKARGLANSAATIFKQIAKGSIPAPGKNGRRLFWNREIIQAWLDAKVAG